MDFTYIKRNNCASEMQPTNAQCEILQETTEETSLNTNKWFSWSNNSENPVNWSDSGFRLKLCARHDLQNNQSTTLILCMHTVLKFNIFEMKRKKKKVYLKASHFKRRQWRQVHDSVNVYQKKVTSMQKTKIPWAKWNATERVNKLLYQVILKAFFLLP